MEAVDITEVLAQKDRMIELQKGRVLEEQGKLIALLWQGYETYKSGFQQLAALVGQTATESEVDQQVAEAERVHGQGVYL